MDCNFNVTDSKQTCQSRGLRCTSNLPDQSKYDNLKSDQAWRQFYHGVYLTLASYTRVVHEWWHKAVDEYSILGSLTQDVMGALGNIEQRTTHHSILCDRAWYMRIGIIKGQQKVYWVQSVKCWVFFNFYCEITIITKSIYAIIYNKSQQKQAYMYINLLTRSRSI